MASVALIRFTQVTPGSPGQAFFPGVTGTVVSVANTTNTFVNSWQIDIVYIPFTSAVPVGTLTFSDNGNTPAGTFTPDLPGSYRVVLTVWDAINRTGVHDSDIRNFVVPLPRHGLVVPPYQLDPNPKPTIASGAPGAKPNEMNIYGLEFGWLGVGAADGLLATTLQTIDGFLPDAPFPAIGSHRPREYLGITGATGDIRAPFVFHVLLDDAGNIFLPSFSNFVFWRVDQSDSFVDFTAHYSSSSKITPSDYVKTASSFWYCGGDNSSGDGVIQEITSGNPSTFGTIYDISPGDFLVSLDTDGAGLRIYTSSASGGNVFKVLLSSPGTPEETLNIGTTLGTLRIDTNVSNYSGTFRGFVLDPINGDIYRFTLLPTMAVDQGPFNIAVGIRALAVGTGSSNGVLFIGGGNTVYTVDINLASVTGSMVYTQFAEINSLDFNLGTLIVTAEDSDGNVVVGVLDPSTLALNSILELGTGTLNAGYGTAAPVARPLLLSGNTYVGNPNVVAPGASGEVWRLETSIGNQLRTSGTTGSTSGTTTYTATGHDLTAEGVLPGDVLINHDPTESYYTVVTVGTTTLTVNRVLVNTSSGLTFEIFTPPVKTKLAQPGPKALGFINEEWQAWSVPYIGLSIPVSLGDGELVGYYRLRGDTVDIRLGFRNGSTTTTDPSGVILPFPPGIVADMTKVPTEVNSSETLLQVIVSDALSPTGFVAGAALLMPFGFLLFDLSALPIGDPATLTYSFPAVIL